MAAFVREGCGTPKNYGRQARTSLTGKWPDSGISGRPCDLASHQAFPHSFTTSEAPCLVSVLHALLSKEDSIIIILLYPRPIVAKDHLPGSLQPSPMSPVYQVGVTVPHNGFGPTLLLRSGVTPQRFSASERNLML
jgi:hypothetical protein